jgi:hypothetical protein
LTRKENNVKKNTKKNMAVNNSNLRPISTSDSWEADGMFYDFYYGGSGASGFRV